MFNFGFEEIYENNTVLTKFGPLQTKSAFILIRLFPEVAYALEIPYRYILLAVDISYDWTIYQVFSYDKNI